MTGSFVFPGVLYLQALGLKRDELIQGMGILFVVSTISVAGSLYSNALLTIELSLLSTVGMVPAIFGMVLGQRIRKHMSEVLFRRVFLLALIFLGLYIGAFALIRFTG